jgi:hypothetical protein
MTHHHSRRSRRHRRPVLPSPTRAQVRQRISRLSVHLGQLNEDAGLLNQILDSLDETA